MKKNLKNTSHSSPVLSFCKEYSSVILLAAMLLLSSIFVPSFASATIFKNIIRQSDTLIIGSIAATFVLILGGMDFSLGYIVAFSSITMGILSTQAGFSPLSAILVAIASGLVWGLINGFIIEYLNVPPFITTLGTGYVIYGILQMMCNGISFQDLPADLVAVANTTVLGLPSSVYFALSIVIVFGILLHLTSFGRKLKAMGFNLKACEISGLNTRKLSFIVYGISGLLAATAGVFMSLRVASCQPTMGGPNFTFQAIMGAVLGGASLFGGKGSVIGAVSGVFILTVIDICMVLLGIDGNANKAVIGVLILLVIVFDSLKNKVNS